MGMGARALCGPAAYCSVRSASSTPRRWPPALPGAGSSLTEIFPENDRKCYILSLGIGEEWESLRRQDMRKSFGNITEPKLYLDYLDREMASLQTLLAFTTSSLTVALGLVLGLGKDPNAHVDWGRINKSGLLLSAIVFIASTGCFFGQRSTLSWLYGRISSAASGYTSPDLLNAFKEADSWRTWLQYRWGWKCLWAAYIEASFVALGYLLKTAPTGFIIVLPDLIVFGILLWGALQTLVFIKWSSSYDPWAESVQWVRRGRRR